MSDSTRPLVLVVDDEPTNRRVFEAMLEALGYDVLCAANGVEAIEQVERVEPDLIMLDWRMPRMDGAAAMPELRRRTEAPIVVVTAYALPEQKARILASGCDGFLAKPLTVDELEASLPKWLAARRPS